MGGVGTRARAGTRKVLGTFVIDTRPLRVAAFRRLWLSGAVTAVGSQLTAVAVPKQVYDLTGSSAYVGLTGAVGLVPLLVFGLLALNQAFFARTAARSASMCGWGRG